MQETLAEYAAESQVGIRMRIGVNTGEVLVGALRAGGDPTVMGDVVNTAQRLEKLAAPGEVIVGPATHAATRAVISYDELGPQGLRGRDEPVDAYRALRVLAPPGRRRGREATPLVGRNAEMRTLGQIVAMAATRRRAQFVLLGGDAGVGKSRLASEVAEVARREHSAVVLNGQCLPYGDANVYGPIGEALRHACTGVAGGDTPTRDVLTARVGAALNLPVGSSELERTVEGILYLMEGTSRPGVDPSRARDDAMRSTLSYLAALASDAPLVLTLSDLHWATDEVLDFLNRMLARLYNQPFVLVATTRPGLEDRWTVDAGKHNAFVLNLEPLDPDATAELVRSLFCGEADENTVRFLLERSGGNPFFVEELVAFVQETTSGSPVTDLPATLHGLVAARLDGLELEERSVLEDCAVVGGSGSVDAVVALADKPNARAVLDRLVDRDLLRIEHDEFHFKSELIREIAYGTLTKAERARRHAAVAPILAARADGGIDQTAHHLATASELVGELGEVGGVPADIREQAIDALLLAADQAEAVEAWLPSERHYDRAVTLLGPENTDRRRQSLLGRARARVMRRTLDEARDDALTALTEARLASDRGSEASALTILGEGEAAIGAYDVAEETLGEALQLWRELDDESGAANVLRSLGMIYLFRGELAQAERFVSESLGSFRSSGNQRGSAWALQNLAWISFSHGNIREAETRLEESADLFGELGDWGGLGWAYGLLAFVRYNQGRLDEAAAIAEHIAIEGRETGNRWAVGMMDVLLANVALWTGRSRECIDRSTDAIELFRDIGDRWGEVMATGSMLRAQAGLGLDAEYEASLARFREVTGAMPDESMHEFPAIVAAGVELQRGHAEDAWALLATTTQLDDATLGAADEASAIGLAHLQLGNVNEALAALEPAFTSSDEDGPRMAIGCRLALAYTAAHRTDDACGVLDDLRVRTGGTFSDRIIALWAEALVQAQRGEEAARGSVDAAHAIATATDARLEQAITALARALVLEGVGDDAAAEREDAERQLAALNVTGNGWRRVFELALQHVPAA
jgi:tetratricopeptide (TPR) repeat protein